MIKRNVQPSITKSHTIVTFSCSSEGRPHVCLWKKARYRGSQLRALVGANENTGSWSADLTRVTDCYLHFVDEIAQAACEMNRNQSCACHAKQCTAFNSYPYTAPETTSSAVEMKHNRCSHLTNMDRTRLNSWFIASPVVKHCARDNLEA